MNISEQVLATDVLVIGAGLAGCFAGIRAKELGADVMIVEQRRSGFSGASVMGMHMFHAVRPGDDLDFTMKGTVEECEYLIDQECAEIALNETWDRFQDLCKFGVKFRLDDSGQFDWRVWLTDVPGYTKNAIPFEPMSSNKHMLNIKKEVVRQGVKVLDNVQIVDLITSNNKVQGAVGFHPIEGGFYLVKAKAVVITSGSFYGPGLYNPQLTGDGVAMALRAGAELRSMEMGQTRVQPIGGHSFLPPGLRPEPDYLVTNAKGEEFFEKYEITRRLPGRRYACFPPRRQHVVLLHELKEGRGPCYMEYILPNSLSFSSIAREFWGSAFHKPAKFCELAGIRAFGNLKYELGIARPPTNPTGGIRINCNCESTIAGLCAAGDASDRWSTASYATFCGLDGAAVTGHRAGESAAKYAQAQNKFGSIDVEQVNRLKRKIFAPLGCKQGVTSDEMRIAIMKAWLNIDLRNETRLKRALEQLQELEKDASCLSAGDYHELAKCHKTMNLIECSQAISSAALMRRETRLDHVRDDYPLTDNKEWLKWMITRRVGDELRTKVEDIPIQRWNYKPKPSLIDPLKLTTEVV